MPQVRTQDALAPKPDLLGDALGRDVGRVGGELQPLKLELLQPVP